MAWVECVPNFSDGRDVVLREALERAIEGVSGARVLDASGDADHHRSVVTFAAPPEGVVEAALSAVSVATERIDLTAHRGVHPRIGATDVCPLVPLEDVSMAECAALARTLARRVADELAVPTYLYGHAARSEARCDLPAVRRVGLRFLREGAARDPELAPDFGPLAPHPTAGACAVGARDFLVAFNVQLATSDVRVARGIAKQIRESDGGLAGIRALGFALPSTGTTQVSMNVCDPRRTGLVRVFEEIERSAGVAGVDVLGSELIGLAPGAALDAEIAARVRLAGFDPDRHVVERRLARVRNA